MGNDENYFELGSPTPYPRSSPAEIKSRNIFHYLIDPKYIKGDVRTMDKHPNSDGILEITNDQGVGIGKFEIQLKTLSAADINNPKHQCQRGFLAFCHDSTLAVLLVVVDNKNNKAYWRYMDSETIAEAANRLTGESVSIRIPSENCIDGTNLNYVSQWTSVVIGRKKRLEEHDVITKRNRDLEEQVTTLQEALQPVTTLSGEDLREIHQFLDNYNFILDKEFKAVKDVRYPSCWKIAIGIFKYQANQLTYILYPVDYTKNEPLIKELKANNKTRLEKMFWEWNALIFAAGEEENYIKKIPLKYAYSMVRGDILKVVGNYNFPVDDEFLAREFLCGFIDKFYVYLNLSKDEDRYSIAHLKELLFTVLPVLIETNMNWADHVREADYNIDQYMDRREEKYYSKRISEASQKIKDGYIPRIKVNPTSQTFNIELIKYYCNYLESKGYDSIVRCYVPMPLNQ